MEAEIILLRREATRRDSGLTKGVMRHANYEPILSQGSNRDGRTGRETGAFAHIMSTGGPEWNSN